MNPKESLRQPDYPFPVYSLFTWTRENDRWLRPILYALKGGRQIDCLERWLVQLSYLRTCHSANPYHPLFVVPPRASPVFGPRVHDHGWAIGQLLAQIWRSQAYDGLWKREIKRTPGSRWNWFGADDRQKLKSRRDRFQMRFEARFASPLEPGLKMKDFQGLRTVVFVDDVITSGATAMAAYMALEDPHSFEVWTLVCRPKLALNPRL